MHVRVLPPALPQRRHTQFEPPMSYERYEVPIVPAWKSRLSLYWQLVRGDRPIGWLLLLWPTWWGLWLAADGMPPLWPLVVFTLGVWLTRSAGCVINDYADRWLDPHVERTKDRPLATGAVRGREALALFAVLMLVAFALVLTLNRLTVYLSFIGVLLAASYPYLKRYTYLPQVYLGVAFGWGIPMAFAAVRGRSAAAGVAAVRGQHPVVDRVRHLVRDGRPRRRPAHGQQVDGDPVR
jgi:4-hydroxybenzoate polyprenyltransferase